IKNSRDIREENQTVSVAENGGCRRHLIGVDVVVSGVLSESNASNDRNVSMGEQQVDKPRITSENLTNVSIVEVLRFPIRKLPRHKATPVAATKTRCLHLALAESGDDVFVNQACQNHLNDLHRGGVCYTQAIMKAAWDIHPFQILLNLFSATVDDDHLMIPLLNLRELGDHSMEMCSLRQ